MIIEKNNKFKIIKSEKDKYLTDYNENSPIENFAYSTEIYMLPTDDETVYREIDNKKLTEYLEQQKKYFDEIENNYQIDTFDYSDCDDENNLDLENI